MPRLFTISELQKRLKEANVPHSLPTLRKYEKEGHLDAPLFYAEGKGVWRRFYLEEELENITANLTALKQPKEL